MKATLLTRIGNFAYLTSDYMDHNSPPLPTTPH